MLARLGSCVHAGVLRLDVEGSCIGTPVNHQAPTGERDVPCTVVLWCDVQDAHREIPTFSQEPRFSITITCYSLFGFTIIMTGVIVAQYNKTVTNYRKLPHTITTKTFKT